MMIKGGAVESSIHGLIKFQMRRKLERQEGKTPEKVEQEGKEPQRRRRRQESVGRRHVDRQLVVGDDGGRCSHLGDEIAVEGDDFEPDSHTADCQVSAWWVTVFPAYSDTLGTREKCHCKQVSL